MLSFKLNLWQPQEPLQYYGSSSEKSRFGYYVTCTVLHEKSKSKIIVTSRSENCIQRWWGCEFRPKLLAWDSDLDLIKWNDLILIHPPEPLYDCGAVQDNCYSYVDYATMSGKLIFFKGMLIHISENNNQFIFGYQVISNKTHLLYKMLQFDEKHSAICQYGSSHDTCAYPDPISNFPGFKLKNLNDMLYTLAVPHYS